MTDGSSDDGADGQTADGERSVEAELAALEAELADDDGGTAADAGTAAERDEEPTVDSVGLDRDASEQYADLLDDGVQAGPERAGAESDAGTEPGGGGLLDRLRGGRSDPVDPSEASEPGEPVVRPGDETADSGTDEDAGGSWIRAAVGGRVGRYLSGRALLATLVAMLAFAGVGRTFVPLVGGPLGLAGGAFLIGLLRSRRSYLECALAGATVGALGVLSGSVSIAFATGATTRLLAVGGLGGLVVALLGTYVGRDLRAGLTGGGDPGVDR